VSHKPHPIHNAGSGHGSGHGTGSSGGVRTGTSSARNLLAVNFPHKHLSVEELRLLQVTDRAL